MTVARAEPRINQIVEEVVARLEKATSKKDSVYFKAPVNVQRNLMLGDFHGAEKPILAVQVLGWEASPQAARRFEGTLRLGVHCIIEDGPDAEKELVRLVSDVVYALAGDVSVGDLVTYLFPVEFAPNVDLTNRTGIGVTTVTFEGRYIWEPSAP